MNEKIIYILLSLFVLTFALFFYGCDTSEDEEWEGFGETEHFPDPYENDHVGYLLANGYPLTDCQECHGENYDGGTSGVSCIGCHADTSAFSEKCNLCHGNQAGDPANPLDQAPPQDAYGVSDINSVTVGAHQSHLTGLLYSDGIACEDCHNVPASWSSIGHIDSSPGEVVFGGIAGDTTLESLWNRETETCSNTYCHGDYVPEWTDVGGSEADCETCHALPPTEDHPDYSQYPTWDCVDCHLSVINAQREITNKSLHINGVVNH